MSPALVGRDVELDRVLTVLDGAIAHSGHIVLISGEPGIGKTRLAEELAALAAEQDALVAWGRVDDAGGAPPYWPWVQMLETLLHDVDDALLREALSASGAPIAVIVPAVTRFLRDPEPLAALDPGAARFRLHTAIVDFLRAVAAHRRLVLIIDDLHWADVSSLELTRFMAARITAARILLAATYRSIDRGDSQAFDDVLGSLSRQPALERLELSGLSEPEVGRFMTQTIGLRPRAASIAAMHARTEGNPFFVGELARLLHSEGRLTRAHPGQPAGVPTGVRDVVRRRLARLPAATTELLAFCAVLGREFGHAVAGAASGQGAATIADILEPALQAGVICDVTGSTGRLRFSHALIRDTIYGELSSVRRATLHARAATALEARGQPRPAQLSELAWHFLQAAPVLGPETALTYRLQAAAAAQAAVSYERAEDDLRQALTLIAMMPEGPDRLERELEVQNQLVVLMIIMRGYATAEVADACARAQALCREIGETDGLFTALNNLATFHHVRGDLSVEAEIAAQLLTIGSQRSSARWLTMGHLFAGMSQLHTGPLAGARENFAAVREIAAKLELSHDVAAASGLHPLPMGLVYSSRCAWVVGAGDEAHEFAERGVRLASALAHPHTLVFAWYLATHLKILVGDVDAVLAASEKAIAYCDEHAFAAYQSWFRIFRGWATCEQGDPERGIADMAPAVAAHRATGARINTPIFVGLLAQGEARRGNYDEALALVDEALATGGEDRLWAPDLHRRRGELLAALGSTRQAQAIDALSTAIALAEDLHAVPFIRESRAALALLQASAAAATTARPGAVPGTCNLTPRERELLRLIGRGLTDKEIASELVISHATVRSHLERIRDKTGRRRRAELTLLAVELGLTSG